MICSTRDIKWVHTAAVLALLLACVMIVFCSTVYADDQDAELAQPQKEVSEVETTQNQGEVQDTAPVQAAPASSAEGAAPAESTQTPESTSGASPSEGIAVSAEEETAPADEAAVSSVDAGPAANDVLPVENEQAASHEQNQAVPAVSVKSEAKVADPADGFDIRNQTITGLKFDEKTGVLSWDPLEAPSDRVIKYLIYMKADNIKNEAFKIFSSSKGLVTKLSTTSVNVDEHVDFKEEFVNCGAADYTFYVKATDGTVGKDDYPLYSKEASTGIYSMGHYLLEVFAYTKVNTYVKKSNSFEETTRRASQSQGGEILMNGTSLTKERGGGGGWYYAYTETRAVRAGTTVELKYVPAQGYVFYSEKFDDGSADTTASTTRSFIMNGAHKIVVLFKQPFAEVVANGIEASSDGLEDIAQSILLSDTSSLKSGVEGYIRMNISQEYGKYLSDADKNVCDNDSTLKSRNIKKGIFLNVEFCKSINQEDLVAVSKLSKPVNITITIPNELKTKKDNIRRTFYLIRIDNGEATVVADGKYDEISGYITEPGLYMIGYKDTRVEGIYSGSPGIVSYAYAAEEPEAIPAAEPASAVQAPVYGPFYEQVEPDAENEEGFPVGAVAAGVVAAGAAYAAWKLLPAVLGTAAK